MNASISRPLVFLVHGFRSDQTSLVDISRYLTKYNFNTQVVDLPTSFQSLQVAARKLEKKVLAQLSKDGGKINFVAHSAGGIIVRLLLLMNKEIVERTESVVFIATPNNGAKFASVRHLFPKFISEIHLPVKGLTKSAINGLHLKKPPHVFYGGIAGVKSIGVVDYFFGESNDGVVETKSVLIPGEMSDFIELRMTHFEIQHSITTAKLVLQFLKNHHFNIRREPMDYGRKFETIVENGFIDDLLNNLSAPNWSWGTMAGKVHWNNLGEFNGWKLQQNKHLSNMRILNNENIRKGWGREKTVKEAIDYIYNRIKIDEMPLETPVEDPYNELKKLKDLKDNGILTEEEYQKKAQPYKDKL
ncbi:SHOCT domain-containing protein [bacterium]|nr:SHOCT domain-containing protein [bacterium]